MRWSLGCLCWLLCGFKQGNSYWFPGWVKPWLNTSFMKCWGILLLFTCPKASLCLLASLFLQPVYKLLSFMMEDVIQFFLTSGWSWHSLLPLTCWYNWIFLICEDAAFSVHSQCLPSFTSFSPGLQCLASTFCLSLGWLLSLSPSVILAEFLYHMLFAFCDHKMGQLF